MSVMAPPRSASLDAMKALGMGVIVFGHVAASAPGATVGPINTKQLGVAVFVFITGFTLSRERRPVAETVCRRLFEFLLLAFCVALTTSAIAWTSIRDLQESNYLPLLFGANVVLDTSRRTQPAASELTCT